MLAGYENNRKRRRLQLSNEPLYFVQLEQLKDEGEATGKTVTNDCFEDILLQAVRTEDYRQHKKLHIRSELPKNNFKFQKQTNGTVTLDQVLLTNHCSCC